MSRRHVAIARAGLAVGLLAGLLAGCAPGRRRWQPRDPVGDEPVTYAIVAASEPIYTAPSPRAPSLALAPPSRAAFTSARLAALRLLRTRGGWAELESPGVAPDDACVAPLGALEGLRLRLFVPEGRLMPVTAREVRQTFADDTSVTLRRGVPLEPLAGTPLYRARLGGVSTVVRLGPTEVGSRYLPIGAPPPAPTPASTGWLGPRTRSIVVGQTGRLEREDPQLALPVYSLRPHGPSESLVELRPRCAVIEARVPNAEAGPTDLVLGALVADGEGGSRPTVEPGAEVYWGDGRPAGQVVTALRLAGDELPARDGRRCFAHPLWGAFAASAEASRVELCFDRAAVLDPGAGLGARLAPP